MRTASLLLIALFFQQSTYSQYEAKRLPAKKTTANFKIDGNLDEAGWKEATPATNFVEQRPNAGRVQDYTNRTEVYILYDNTSIYVGGYCHEQTKDSISRELVGRDNPGINDLVGVLLDTYNDKINAVGFYVTPYGEQYDQKYSAPDLRDPSWSAVWASASKIHADGWTFEIRIPYSALRFVSKDNQTWGINFVRTRTVKAQQFTWSPINPQVQGFVNQAGEWTGIEKIDAPLRLSFSPYLSAYVNHYKLNPKPWSTSINGGMDVKYGINESFTLDMTLVPDFGQVQSDNQVLNLSPFETQYAENRSFFTEGTELFNKGSLFHSRRVGGRPLHYYDVYNQATANENVIRNPQESKLINATKISGRTKNGLGVGFFNALTKPMYAEVQDNTNKQIRKVETSPLTNYNIIVFDQNLKNHSSVSFINTNVWRSGSDYDANVSAGLFSINNKKSTYNYSGKLAVSQLLNKPGKNVTGFSENLVFSKTGGNWFYRLTHEVADEKYNINDMGILFTNNYINHSLWTYYKWITPTNWYNNIFLNFNAGYSTLYKPFSNQKLDTKFQSFNTNLNANAQLKNLWNVGFFMGYVPEGNDFYEPRHTGRSFRTTERVQFSGWAETNSSKKYFVGVNYFIGLRSQFKSRNNELNLFHRYRFNDKFSISQSTFFNPFTNDAGYYKDTTVSGFDHIIFSRRDRNTIENVLSAKYNFNNRAGLTFRVRHYWSKVNQKELYDLKPDGKLSPTIYPNIVKEDFNLNFFNIDATYTWQFAPGSFINIVWKDEGQYYSSDSYASYFKNFDRTITEPQNNNLSIKFIYYLDYLDFKKWRKKAA